jgi:hypothetical protein
MAAGRRSKARAKIHGRLEIMGLAQLDIHLDVLREAAHKQLCVLEGGQVAGMAQHSIEAIGELLYHRLEGQPGELGQMSAMNSAQSVDCRVR